MSNEAIRSALFEAIDEVNLLLPKQDHLIKNDETALYGAQSALDSVNLINLLVAFEDRLESHVGRSLSLTTDPGILQDGKPLTSVNTLLEYVDRALEN